MSTSNSSPPPKPESASEHGRARADSSTAPTPQLERVPELPAIDPHSDEDPGEQTVRIDPSLLNFDDVPDAE